MKKSLCHGLGVLILLLLIETKISAQHSNLKWGIGFHGLTIEPKTSLGNDFFSFRMDKVSLGQGLSVMRYLNSSFDLGVYFSNGRMAQNSGVYHLNNLLYVADLRIKWKLNNGYILKSDAFVGPFISAGMGVDYADVNAFGETEGEIKRTISQMDIYAGAGIRFRVSEKFSLEIQSGIHLPSDNRWDANLNGVKDQFLEHSIGLIVNLGTTKDSDQDGISDKRDKCPDSPIASEVDELGCPIDSDNDGIADYLDECPTLIGSLLLNGCPDKDNDGIVDQKDRCPDTAGLISMAGCPDSDEDGVADPDDRCPETKFAYKVDSLGCPIDMDGDDVVDEEDLCPTEFGLVSLSGCPDKDTDGVPDKDDKCPDSPGLLANNGCPDLPVEVSKQISNIAGKIFFESGSTDLLSVSEDQLESLARIMQAYPETNLSIEGHTDNTGIPAQNMLLSQERCESVKRFLISKGIESHRLFAKGLGQSQPIANNNSLRGRAKNRRVELKTIY